MKSVDDVVTYMMSYIAKREPKNAAWVIGDANEQFQEAHARLAQMGLVEAHAAAGCARPGCKRLTASPREYGAYTKHWTLTPEEAMRLTLLEAK